MLIVKYGDIFESRCYVLVNPVNCVGVMGKGLALEFREKYPDMYTDYVQRCARKYVAIGYPYLYHCPDGKAVLNFPTKKHWKEPSRTEYVETGLSWFRQNYDTYKINSIAFPALGCGNGGLPWPEVATIMYKWLKPIPINIEIYAPQN